MDKTDKVEDPNQVKAKEYVEQLTELQLKAMNIAQEHLGLSFNLLKSVGYIQYKAAALGAAEKEKTN
jgi:hypothetical protein